MRIHENAYLQMQEGAISDAHWQGVTRMMIDYTDMAAFPSYWADRKHWSSDEFIEHLESDILPQRAEVAIGPKTG